MYRFFKGTKLIGNCREDKDKIHANKSVSLFRKR
jgi:hypothetical protein